jgi:DNA-binding NarL/FixJ family response regulator
MSSKRKLTLGLLCLPVKGHVRSIYNKIHVNSRSAATRYAIEHRLA